MLTPDWIWLPAIPFVLVMQNLPSIKAWSNFNFTPVLFFDGRILICASLIRPVNSSIGGSIINLQFLFCLAADITFFDMPLPAITSGIVSLLNTSFISQIAADSFSAMAILPWYKQYSPFPVFAFKVCQGIKQGIK